MSDIIGSNEPLQIVQCNKCIHYLRQNAGASCKAFDKIPVEILTGEFKHTKIHPLQISDYTYIPEV